MDTVDIKLGLLRSRAGQLGERSQRSFSALVSQLDRARSALGVQEAQLPDLAREEAPGAILDITLRTEALERAVDGAWRRLHYLQRARRAN